MTDVLDDLKEALAIARVGAAIPYIPIIKRAISEIERLRRKAGAVSDGESFEERLARAGAPMVKYERFTDVADNSLIKADRIVDKPSDTE